MADVVDRRVTMGTTNNPEITDPVDIFLDNLNLCRKIVFRDADSLFRVVSEQLYDTQMLHEEVRMECIRFMFRKRGFFQRRIKMSFDEYLRCLANAESPGSMLEVRALCHLYRRNVFIYKPLQPPRQIILSQQYRENFHIFVEWTNFFHSVYPRSDIGDAAVGQAVAFKLMYKMLFRLPDVELATEMMLHPETFKAGTHFESNDDENAVRLHCANGRSFKLDRPDETLCLFVDHTECPFHNKELQKGKPISCTRIVLYEKRWPFPFAAAKSLDPHIYRNVEHFWAKEIRCPSLPQNFTVGSKCRVFLSGTDKGNLGCIQAIHNYSCDVQLETTGQVIVAAFWHLQSLSPGPPRHRKPFDSRQQPGRSPGRNTNERQTPLEESSNGLPPQQSVQMVIAQPVPSQSLPKVLTVYPTPPLGQMQPNTHLILPITSPVQGMIYYPVRPANNPLPGCEVSNPIWLYQSLPLVQWIPQFILAPPAAAIQPLPSPSLTFQKELPQ